MNCPKCRSVMRTVLVEEFTIDCRSFCEGIWFDLREHDHLKEIHGSEDRIDTGDPVKGETMDILCDINCPRCGVKLVKLSMPDQTHIKYEQCATCGGAFFDAGEFTDYKHMTVTERWKHVFKPLLV